MTTLEKLTSNAIRNYFGCNHVHFHVSTFGKLVIIDLTYQDFKPIPEVREWLNRHIPFLWNMNVERTYSKKVVRSTLNDMLNNDLDMQKRMEESLFVKDFSQSVHQGGYDEADDELAHGESVKRVS